MVMPWRAATVAALHRRRGTWQSVPWAGGPGLPSAQDLRGKAPGARMRGPRATDNLQGRRHLGCPPGPARTGPLGLPRHLGEPRLLGPRPPETRARSVLQVLPHPCPPTVHERRQVRARLCALLHRRLPIRPWMPVGERCHGLPLSLHPAFHLLGGLASGVLKSQRMPRQREGLKALPRRALERFPAPHCGVGALPLPRRRAGDSLPRRTLLGPLESGLSLRPRLACWPPLPAHGERIPLHDGMPEVPHLWETPALPPWCGALEAGLRPGTDQGAHGGSQRGKPLIHEAFPGRIAALFPRCFPQERPRGEVQKDQQQTVQEGVVPGATALGPLSSRGRVPLPGVPPRHHRLCQRLPDASSCARSTAHRRRKRPGGATRAHGVQAHAPLQATGSARGNDQARQPPAALGGFPHPGLRRDIPTRAGRRATRRPALGHSRVLGPVAHPLRARLTTIVENPNTLLPNSQVGPVLQRVAELSPACSSSKDMTDTSLSRLRPLPRDQRGHHHAA
jgi:hypothetical protein